MAKSVLYMSMSLDGFITGPDDGPGNGLGTGGEPLHNWVFGGPWSYNEAPTGKPGRVEQEWFDSVVGRMGSAVAGRNMYEVGSHRGDTNPWGVTCFHRHPPRRRPRRRCGHPARQSLSGERAPTMPPNHRQQPFWPVSYQQRGVRRASSCRAAMLDKHYSDKAKWRRRQPSPGGGGPALAE